MKDKLKYIEIAIVVALCIGALIMGIIFGKNDSSENDENRKNAIFLEEDVFEEEKISKNIVVEIKGEVNKPDVYSISEGSIIKDLIESAGGLTTEADISNINRARKVSNNECVIIGKKGEVVNSVNETSKAIDNGLVNINTATSAELDSLPDIGPSRADAIVKYRENSGGFKTIEEIKNISGIGEKSFEKIKHLICV